MAILVLLNSETGVSHGEVYVETYIPLFPDPNSASWVSHVSQSSRSSTSFTSGTVP